MADNTVATPGWAVIKDDGRNYASSDAVVVASAADGDRATLMSNTNGFFSVLEGQRHAVDVVRHEGQEVSKAVFESRHEAAKEFATLRLEMAQMECRLKEANRDTQDLIKDQERRDIEKQLSESKSGAALLQLKIDILNGLTP